MKVAVLGEALFDLIQGEDGAYRPHPGGSPRNVAIGLARQGMDVSYLSPLGRDSLGETLAAEFIAEGVNLPHLPRSSMPTSLALVSLDESGAPSYTLYREGIADKDATFEEVRDHLPEGLRVFHTGSLAITPSQLPKIRQLFEHFRKNDVLISVDINIRLGASADTRAYLEGVLSLMPWCDLVKASDEDLLSLQLGDDLSEAATKIFQLIEHGLLVLTEGKKGARLFVSDDSVEIPACAVPQIADTIGAGDTFHSAFIAELARLGLLTGPFYRLTADSFTPALEYACAAAAINVSRVGCEPPVRSEVERFLQTCQR